MLINNCRVFTDYIYPVYYEISFLTGDLWTLICNLSCVDLDYQYVAFIYKPTIIIHITHVIMEWPYVR